MKQSMSYRSRHIVVIVVLQPVPAAEVGVKPSPGGCVLGPVVAQMPLAHRVRGVADTLQVLREELLRQRKSARLRFEKNEMLHPWNENQ